MPATFDKLLAQVLLHSHKQGDLKSVALTGTKATILATTAAAGKVAYSTDTNEFYIHDGTNWTVAPLKLNTELSAPDMGAHNTDTTVQGFTDSDKSGYYSDAIDSKTITNSTIKGNINTAEGSIRTTSSGVFQIYLNSTWNDVVINFVFREDSNQLYELEHQPVGFNSYFEVASGNSDTLGVDGKPMFVQYTSSMGAYQRDLLISGGTF